jgi:hypothetical protein
VAAPQASSAPEPTAEPEPVAPAAAPAPPRERRSAEAIDLLDVAGAPVAKRLAPLVAFVALLLVFVTLRRRKS